MSGTLNTPDYSAQSLLYCSWYPNTWLSQSSFISISIHPQLPTPTSPHLNLPYLISPHHPPATKHVRHLNPRKPRRFHRRPATHTPPAPHALNRPDPLLLQPPRSPRHQRRSPRLGPLLLSSLFPFRTSITIAIRLRIRPRPRLRLKTLGSDPVRFPPPLPSFLNPNVD
jgi:hypothetical protein